MQNEKDIISDFRLTVHSFFLRKTLIVSYIIFSNYVYACVKEADSMKYELYKLTKVESRKKHKFYKISLFKKFRNFMIFNIRLLIYIRKFQYDFLFLDLKIKFVECYVLRYKTCNGNHSWRSLAIK